MLREHGVDNPAQMPVYAQKKNATCEKTYVPNYWAKFIETRKRTCIEEFGKEHYTQTDEYKKLRQEIGRSPESVAKWINTMIINHGKPYYSQTDEFKKNYRNYCMEAFGVPSALCLPENRKFGKTQKEICDWLNSNGIRIAVLAF